MAGMSSAVRGLLPKSAGGRMALGASAIGIAGGVTGYQQRSSGRSSNAVSANSLSHTGGFRRKMQALSVPGQAD
jgi:hypothetical protein